MNTIFVDVNGTLLRDGTRHDEVHAADFVAVAERAGSLRDMGVQVGLCSDSPLAQLKTFAGEIGFADESDPAIAENGNVYWNGQQRRELRAFTELPELKEQIARMAEHAGLTHAPDFIAPEFRHGTLPLGNVYAFGANRTTSLSLCAPPAFLQVVATHVRYQCAPCGVDVNLDSGILIVHPYARIVDGKAQTLRQLSYDRARTLMIGNSDSDWVPSTSNVRCGFVRNARISTSIASAAWHVSAYEYEEGVADCMARAIREMLHD